MWEFSSLLTPLQGYYDTSDAGVMDKAGYISVMARTDDVINISGHRISTKALEEVCTGGENFFSLSFDWP